MRWRWLLLGALTLAGCGGGSGAARPHGRSRRRTAPPGQRVPPGLRVPAAAAVVTFASNATPATAAAAAAWAALAPQVTVTSVTIASPPVVNFTVTDAAGNPVVGLGNTSQSSTATLSPALPTWRSRSPSWCRAPTAARASGSATS